MIQSCCSISRKKYFNDPNLNSITYKISSERQDIFVEILKEHKIKKIEDLNILFIDRHPILARLQEAEKSLLIKRYYEDESLLTEVKFEMVQYNYKNKDYPTYGILLFGIKGEGKKSFVNTLCSYLNGGVRSERENRVIYQRKNDCRFEIKEQEQPILIHSDTLQKRFKIYNCQNPSSDYVVSTLKNNKDIHVIGFVGSQQQGSLSLEQQTFLKQVCSYLPKDKSDRIFHFITFSDMIEMTPEYYQNEFKFLKDQSYQIQNEAIFGKRKGFIVNIQFERTIKSIQNFIEKLPIQTQTLDLVQIIEDIQNCRQVLQDNQYEQVELKKKIQVLIGEIQKLELKVKKEEITRKQNENYKYKEAASKYTKEKLRKGRQATVCHLCNNTCCIGCEAVNLEKCSNFVGKKCEKCQCSSEKHELVDYRIFTEIIQLEKENKEMKEQFEIAEEKIKTLKTELENKKTKLTEQENNYRLLEEVIEKVKNFLNDTVIIGA